MQSLYNKHTSSPTLKKIRPQYGWLTPILLLLSNSILHFTFNFFTWWKVPLFQSPPVSPHTYSQATLLFTFREEPGLRVRKSQIRTRVRIRNKESQHEIMKAGMTQEPSVRTVGQNSLLSNAFSWDCSSITKVHGWTHQIRCLVQITQVMLRSDQAAENKRTDKQIRPW